MNNQDLTLNKERKMAYLNKTIDSKGSVAHIAIIGLFMVLLRKTEQWKQLMRAVITSNDKTLVYNYYTNYILSLFNYTSGRSRNQTMHWSTAHDYSERITECPNSPAYEYLMENKEKVEDFVLGAIEGLNEHYKFDAERVIKETELLKEQKAKKANKSGKSKEIKGIKNLVKTVKEVGEATIKSGKENTEMLASKLVDVKESSRQDMVSLATRMVDNHEDLMDAVAVMKERERISHTPKNAFSMEEVM